MKGEPAWMLEFRLKALEHFLTRPMPTWGPTSAQLDFDNIIYYVQPAESEGKTWDDVPDDIKKTFDKLGIPEAERSSWPASAPSTSRRWSTTTSRSTWPSKGVIFVSIEDGLTQHPDLFREYFGTVIPHPRQQVRRAQQRGLVGRIVHLRAARASRSTCRCRPTSASTRPTSASSSAR